MKKNNGYATKELLIVIAVFSVAYFIGVGKVSYAFSNDEAQSTYDNRVNLLEHQAKLYAENNPNLFSENNIIDIYAKDLVKNNYFVGNDNGDIVDPRDTSKTLDDLKIEITKTENDYSAKVMS